MRYKIKIQEISDDNEVIREYKGIADAETEKVDEDLDAEILIAPLLVDALNAVTPWRFDGIDTSRIFCLMIQETLLPENPLYKAAEEYLKGLNIHV